VTLRQLVGTMVADTFSKVQGGERTPTVSGPNTFLAQEGEISDGADPLDSSEEDDPSNGLLNEDPVNLVRDSRTGNLSARRPERIHDVLPVSSNTSSLARRGGSLSAYFHDGFFLSCFLAYAIVRNYKSFIGE
jgi:hypothetical protein